MDKNPLKIAMKKARSSFIGVWIFSCAINILMLTGPLFMLQVYDRVLTSRSVPTLVALFGLVVAMFAFIGLFEFTRSKLLSRIGLRLDNQLRALAHKNWVVSGLYSSGNRIRPISDLSSIRQFIGSNGVSAMFDLPWVPFYLAIVYLLHIWLGLLATAGAILVIFFTILNEFITKNSIGEAAQWDNREADFSESTNRNAESVVAMGMLDKVENHWACMRDKALSASQAASERNSVISAFTKSIRMIVQSGILALGAYLAIFQEISPGTMIAASILAGRALAPIDAAVGNWKGFVRCRQSYARLKKIMSRMGSGASQVQLPEPKGKLSLQGATVLSKTHNSEETFPILQNLSFALQPGEGLGVIGPSGAGKSSLARLMVGNWPADRGEIRLDGATYDQWDRDRLGEFIGYLPQAVELLPGTVRQNISRFNDDISDEDIIEAAQTAGVHELILTFSDGYQTEIGRGGTILSGGQAQRIALARAVLRKPALVVMDEPNSNLDSDGDAALTKAIEELRKAGSTVVVMAHRPSAIAAVNKILMLQDGMQREFGPKEDVLKKVTRTASPVVKPPVKLSPNKVAE